MNEISLFILFIKIYKKHCS